MKKVLTMTLAAALCSAGLAAASLDVTVTDRDLEFPLEGVILELAGTSAQETDPEGKARIELPEGFTRGILSARLPGYADTKVPVTASQKSIAVTLGISEVIEGQELVVERSAPGKTDAAPGVSVAMTMQEMDTTANFGLVEDVMSSIMTLPGIGFSGGFNAMPSIRGGYPNEMGTVMDDIYVLQPWHWGGAYSIFNPNMTSSAKMSHGIFSARYGRAMSGLLEVTTKTPESSRVRIDAGISTNAIDLFAQVPLGPKAGFFAGGKVSYMEPAVYLNDEILDMEPKVGENLPTPPFIRDAYAKAYFIPDPSLDITVNGFFGSDGIGTKGDTTNDGVRTVSGFNWLYLQGFAGTNIKWLPNDKSRVHFVGSYNQIMADLDMKFETNGTWTYSDAFLAAFDTIPFPGIMNADPDGKIDGETGYTLKDFGMNGFSRQIVRQFQGKLEAERLFGSNVLSLGGEAVVQMFRSEQEFSGWQIVNALDPAEYRNFKVTNNLEGNRIINSSAFALWNYGTADGRLTGEAGIRGEHFYLWNDTFTLNTWPVADPRVNASWKAMQNRGVLDVLTLSAGTGVFSMFPPDSIAASQDYGIKSFEISPDRAWFQVLGAEADLADGWLFRIESYYKHYFSRLYLTGFYDTDTNGIKVTAHTNGKGYSAGADFFIQKKDGRYFDGYLSYSFNIAKFNNPDALDSEGNYSFAGEPLKKWFYPSFHRFHNLNLVLNWKPARGITFTTKASLASGAPKAEAGETYMYPVLLVQDGTTRVIERYKRTENYSDTLRTDLSCPVDFRLAFSDYYPGTKVRWEMYFGLEDAFVNIYSPKTNPGFDEFTGKELENSDQADFGIGIPIPSVGFKISY